MNLSELKKNWDQFGRDDPYWAILTDPEMKDNKWDEAAFFETGQRIVNRLSQRIKRFRPNYEFSSALDFGCGAGRLTQALANQFDQVSGVDIAPSMIQLANEKNKKENCTYFLNEKNDLSLFSDESFDVVLSLITLQHMKPKYAKKYISEFLRVLKPEGVIEFQIPSKPDLATSQHHSTLKRILRKIKGVQKPDAKKMSAPVMEMYWIPIQEMVWFLNSNGAHILNIRDIKSAGQNWVSYTYTISKKPRG